MEKQLLEISINKCGELCEIVVFNPSCSEEYTITGVVEHIIYGIFFSFHKKKL